MKIKNIIIILTMLIIILPIAIAYDPGHDTLYVFKIGDNVSGYLNVSGNLTGNMVYTYTRFFGPDLTIISDGGTSANPNVIQGTSADLAINSPILILNRANGAMVYVGQAGATASFNVTGSLYVNNKLACLADGTNCPSALSGANVTVNGATAGYIAQFQNASTLNNSVIFQNGTNIGIGTNAPTQKLDVNGNINISLAGGTIYAPRVFQNGTQVAGQGDCTVGLFVQNITNGTPECGTPTAAGDGNNYTLSIGLNATGSTLQLNENRSGSAANLTSIATMNDTTRTLAGYINLTGSLCIQNLSLLSTGLSYSSITPTGTGDGNNYTLAIGFNGTTQAQLNLNRSGSTANLTTTIPDIYLVNTGDIGRGNYTFDDTHYVLVIDTTNDRVGIGTASPTSTLTVAGNTNMTTYNISTINCILFDSGGKICSGT
jgi:hypothetical protein